MPHYLPCRGCRQFTRTTNPRFPVCQRCSGKRFAVRCRSCGDVAHVHVGQAPICDECAGEFCTRCHRHVPGKYFRSVDQVCFECAKILQVFYTCDRCGFMFSVDADAKDFHHDGKGLPSTKPGYVLCWHCVLQDEGEIRGTIKKGES